MKREEIEKFSVRRLETEIRRHNSLYFVKHAPEISDQEFDLLVEILRKKKPDSLVLVELGSDVTAAGKKVRHERPMLSLDKCYDEKRLGEWASKFEGEMIAMPKIDGCALSLRYDGRGRLAFAITRGNGVEGEDVTENAKHVKDIPQSILLKGVEVRGEVFMPLNVFSEYRGQFANPRNLAAGVIKLKQAQKTADYRLAFLAYDLLGSNAVTEQEKRSLLKRAKIPVVEWRVASRDEMQKIYDAFFAERENWDFETDGVVFRVNRLDEQERLGNTAHHPRSAIAYKFQGEEGTTKLLDVEWSVSRTGAITPVGMVEPVELSGAMVKRASLHNVGLMKKLNITKGAVVLMMRRGGVIPHLESVLKPGREKIAIPKRCPSCGSPTQMRDDFLFCTNPKTCVRSKVGELAHFVNVVEIDGFGEKLLEQLSEQGLVTDVSEFYELTLDELLRLERMGETLAMKLLRNIEAKRVLPLDVFLQSLGIREVGKQVSKILAGKGSLAAIQVMSEEELAEIHTIGPVIAYEIVAGLKAKRQMITRLLKQVKIETPRGASRQGLLTGKSVLFTGTLAAMERKKAQHLVEKAGGIVAKSVTKELDFLVIGDKKGGGTKLEKAKKMQQQGAKVEILTESNFWGRFPMS